MMSHDGFAHGATIDVLAPRILDRQQTGIAALDAQQRVVVWNNWIAQWTGVTPAQALHQRLDDLFPALVGGGWFVRSSRWPPPVSPCPGRNNSTRSAWTLSRQR